MVMRQYQVAGRRAPKDKLDHPTIFRMNVFAPNGIVARSRFWYFLSKLEKAKRTTGEILGCHEIKEVKPTKVKNIGIWIRYDSRSGSHNAYKEYRALSFNEAVELMYQDMSARHRVEYSRINIVRISEIAAKFARRGENKKFLDSKLSFPLVRRFTRTTSKSFKSLYAAKRPSVTF